MKFKFINENIVIILIHTYQNHKSSYYYYFFFKIPKISNKQNEVKKFNSFKNRIRIVRKA